VCSKQQKQQQQQESFFWVFFCPAFSSFFIKKGKLFVPHHGIIKPTKTPRFCAAFKVQAGISGSAFVSSSSARDCFCFSFSFWALNLSRSSSSSSSSSLYVLFSKVFPGDPFFSSSNLPRDDNRVSCPRRRRRRRKRSRGEA